MRPLYSPHEWKSRNRQWEVMHVSWCIWYKVLTWKEWMLSAQTSKLVGSWNSNMGKLNIPCYKRFFHSFGKSPNASSTNLPILAWAHLLNHLGRRTWFLFVCKVCVPKSNTDLEVISTYTYHLLNIINKLVWWCIK